MIDINLIRENPDFVKENIKKKFQDHKFEIVDKIAKIDVEWRNYHTRIDKLRHERNKISKEIAELKKQKKSVDKLMEMAKEIPKKIEETEYKSGVLKEEIDKLLKKIPNIFMNLFRFDATLLKM